VALEAYALGWTGWTSALNGLRRIVPLALLLALPAWAALSTTLRTAELPAAGPQIAWELVDSVLWSLDRLLDPVEVAAEDPGVAVSDEEPPAADPVARAIAVFPPSVARWRELVDGEIAALRGTRGLHEAVTTDLVLAVIAAESGGDPAAQSPAQAVGLMQVLPATVAALVPGAAAGGQASAFDPSLNVRAGILYLDEAVRRHDGDVAWALAAYNAGIPASLRARTVGWPLWSESNHFVARVMAALPPGS